MKRKGVILAGRKYTGSTTPPLTWEDESRFSLASGERDGVFTNAPTWARMPSGPGLWVLGFVAATLQIVTFGDCGVARTLVFWIRPDSLTESILEETAAVGVSINAGTMVYGSWDNCYVDAVDTDTFTVGWHLVVITSTTDVDVSAFRIGILNVTYLDGIIGNLRLFEYELNADQINGIFAAERWYFFGV